MNQIHHSAHKHHGRKEPRPSRTVIKLPTQLGANFGIIISPYSQPRSITIINQSNQIVQLVSEPYTIFDMVNDGTVDEQVSANTTLTTPWPNPMPSTRLTWRVINGDQPGAGGLVSIIIHPFDAGVGGAQL